MALSDANMTKGHGDLDANIDASVIGMAHWAGTGPPATFCYRCAHWGGPSQPKRYDDGHLRPRRCQKFASLAGGAVVRRGVPAETASCRHYQPADKPANLWPKRPRPPD